MACDEMMLFYAYLDEVEEAKKRAQPWQCQVTVMPPDTTAGKTTPESGKSGFSCDETE